MRANSPFDFTNRAATPELKAYPVSAELTYEQLRERLDAWIKTNAQRKIMKARREERNRVRQLGGGEHIAALMLRPCKQRKRR